MTTLDKYCSAILSRKSTWWTRFSGWKLKPGFLHKLAKAIILQVSLSSRRVSHNYYPLTGFVSSFRTCEAAQLLQLASSTPTFCFRVFHVWQSLWISKIWIKAHENVWGRCNSYTLDSVRHKRIQIPVLLSYLQVVFMRALLHDIMRDTTAALAKLCL